MIDKQVNMLYNVDLKETIMDMRKRRYKNIKHGCKTRVDAAGNPIEFRLTEDEWWDIWQASGKYELYGNRKGQYCMSRYNDIGHYEVGNVFIQLHSENIRQSNKGRKQTKEVIAERVARLKGRKLSPDVVAKRVEIKIANGTTGKGRIPWNKGKKYSIKGNKCQL